LQPEPDIIVDVPDIIVELPPEPDVIVEVPDVIVELPEPSPQTVIEQVTPGYIWAIIIIGGVLVIAVVTPTLRTRREQG